MFPSLPTPNRKPGRTSRISKNLFRELGFADSMGAVRPTLFAVFSGDIAVSFQNRCAGRLGIGYALSILVTGVTFKVARSNRQWYGDGRAISVLKPSINGQRWEIAGLRVAAVTHTAAALTPGRF